MYTKLECETRLRTAYPEIYRVAMRNSWWHPVSTLRIWVSFEDSGYGNHLQGIEGALTELRHALSDRDYGRICDGLFDRANFWGHLHEVCTARWLLSRGVEIVEVERPYGGRRPDFTVAYKEDEGVIECKSLQSTATEALQLSPGDALVYLMHSLEGLQFEISFDALPADETGVYNMVSDVLAWTSSDEIQSIGNDTKRSTTLPSGYGVTVARGTGWSVLGSSGSLYATTGQ